jgi:hypothetical protein
MSDLFGNQSRRKVGAESAQKGVRRLFLVLAPRRIGARRLALLMSAQIDARALRGQCRPLLWLILEKRLKGFT